jgi:hypothetical protein
MVIIAIGIAFSSLVLRMNIKEIALSLNAYSNFISAFLTAVLVGITAFYALVTNRMLIQMKESRQSLVRPILWVTFDKPEFKEGEYPDEDKYFRTKAHISNYGKGAAVSIRTQYTIPHEWSDEHKFVMPIGSSGSGDIPSLLSPGESFDMSIRIPTRTVVDKTYPKYLTASVLYEDTERNLYEFTQSYYLHPIPTTGPYLHLETESLYFIPLNERTNVWDDNEVTSGKGILVFNRKLPWRW